MPFRLAPDRVRNMGLVDEFAYRPLLESGAGGALDRSDIWTSIKRYPATNAVKIMVFPAKTTNWPTSAIDSRIIKD
jgi:hypothetical protein